MSEKQTEQSILTEGAGASSTGAALVDATTPTLGTLGTIEGPIVAYDKETRNGRYYSTELWDKVWNSPEMDEAFTKAGGLFGELDHPEDRTEICSDRIAVLMKEPPVKKDDGYYWGKFTVLDTPCGRIVKAASDAGYHWGASSRGTGDFNKVTGEVDPDSYKFTCVDLVVTPSISDARMSLAESLQSTTKAKINTYKNYCDYKQNLNEALQTAKNKEERDLMRAMGKKVSNHILENMDAPKEWKTFIKQHPEVTEKFDWHKYGKYFDESGKVVNADEFNALKEGLINKHSRYILEESLSDSKEWAAYKEAHPENLNTDFDWKTFGKYFDAEGKCIDVKGFDKALAKLLSAARLTNESEESRKENVNEENLTESMASDFVSELKRQCGKLIKNTNLFTNKEDTNITCELDHSLPIEKLDLYIDRLTAVCNSTLKKATNGIIIVRSNGSDGSGSKWTEGGNSSGYTSFLKNKEVNKVVKNAIDSNSNLEITICDNTKKDRKGINESKEEEVTYRIMTPASDDGSQPEAVVKTFTTLDDAQAYLKEHPDCYIDYIETDYEVVDKEGDYLTDADPIYDREEAIKLAEEEDAELVIRRVVEYTIDSASQGEEFTPISEIIIWRDHYEFPNRDLDLHESKEEGLINTCVICGRPFKDKYDRNNGEPVVHGDVCSDCNDTVVIPARLKQFCHDSGKGTTSNESLTEETTTDDAGANIDAQPAEGEEDHNECQMAFDDRLKDLISEFVVGLEVGKTKETVDVLNDEEEDRFVTLFHEEFPDLVIPCEGSEINNEEVPNNEEPVSDAEGELSVVEQLQEALSQRDAYKKKLKEVQEEKAAGNIRVKNLRERLSQTDSASKEAGRAILEEEEQFRQDKDLLNKEIESLKEELQKNKHERDALQESLNKTSNIARQYKDLAQDCANQYIESKAISLGTSSEEIKSRLNENFTLNDVDQVCEDLRQISFNLNKLPFNVGGSIRANLTEDRSRDPLKGNSPRRDPSIIDFTAELADSWLESHK